MSTPESVRKDAATHHYFDDIATRYDLVNPALSFGLDILWRRALIKRIQGPVKKVLDLATGTATLAILLAKAGAQSVTGIDLSRNMLEKGKAKVEGAGLDDAIVLSEGDACALGYLDGSFDLVTVGFGLRNVPHVARALSEAYRVLKPGGKLLSLDFYLPESPIMRAFFQLYLFTCLPLIGGMLTGHFAAYWYLAHSIKHFPCSRRMGDIFRQVGFKDVRTLPMAFGSVVIHEGEK